jgi:hypothetical protein
MTHEAQRIALALACPERLRQVHGRWQYFDGTYWFNCKQNDPLGDLNAMHVAEKVLTDEQRGQMMDALCEIVRRDHNPEAGPMTAIIAAFFATAAQRAEAFLRTLNLWHP